MCSHLLQSIVYLWFIILSKTHPRMKYPMDIAEIPKWHERPEGICPIIL